MYNLKSITSESQRKNFQNWVTVDKDIWKPDSENYMTIKVIILPSITPNSELINYMRRKSFCCMSEREEIRILSTEGCWGASNRHADLNWDHGFKNERKLANMRTKRNWWHTKETDNDNGSTVFPIYRHHERVRHILFHNVFIDHMHFSPGSVKESKYHWVLRISGM